MQCAIIYGPEFNINNGIIYDFLLLLTPNGPKWPWFNIHQGSRNGRAAWNALVSYYEGNTMHTKSKQENYQVIAGANCQSPMWDCDFNTYVPTHQ
jgi:hypothetical protein